MRLRAEAQHGLFAMTYDTQGTGVAVANSSTSWALSGAIRGRGLLVAWMYRDKTKPRHDFLWTLPPKSAR